MGFNIVVVVVDVGLRSAAKSPPSSTPSSAGTDFPRARPSTNRNAAEAVPGGRPSRRAAVTAVGAATAVDVVRRLPLAVRRAHRVQPRRNASSHAHASALNDLILFYDNNYYILLLVYSQRADAEHNVNKNDCQNIVKLSSPSSSLSFRAEISFITLRTSVVDSMRRNGTATTVVAVVPEMRRSRC